jgi:hypothetical protein
MAAIPLLLKPLSVSGPAPHFPLGVPVGEAPNHLGGRGKSSICCPLNVPYNLPV